MAAKEALTNVSEGWHVGIAAAALVGFWGATPVAQPSGTSQSAVSTATITAVSTVTPVVSGYGFSTTAQAQAFVTAVNDVITRQAAEITLLNQLRSDLVTAGIIKGSA